MLMVPDIRDFIVVEKRENGKVNISYDVNCRTNIYKFLKNIGFCQTKLENKRIFYRRTPEGIAPVSFEAIEDAFFDRLQKRRFSTIPDVEYADIFNLFLVQNPIGQYKSFYEELKDDLDEQEVHEYLIKSDSNYRCKNELKEVNAMLKRYKFNRTVDVNGVFSKMAPLFYKRVTADRYLIFSHYNVKERSIYQGFDCWLVQFVPNIHEDINKKELVYKELVKANFKMKESFKLITSYLND